MLTARDELSEAFLYVQEATLKVQLEAKRYAAMPSAVDLHILLAAGVLDRDSQLAARVQLWHDIRLLNQPAPTTEAEATLLLEARRACQEFSCLVLR